MGHPTDEVRHVEVNGVKLAYEIVGSGSPLVLVHGSWSDRNSWNRVADGLSRDFTVVRYDRRGHGDSERATGTTRDDVEDLAELIERLDLAPAHVACSSFGGVIGLKLAGLRGGLLRSLVAHEPPAMGVIPPEHPARPGVDRAAADLETVRRQIEAGDHAGAARRFVDEVAFGAGAWARLSPSVRARMAHHAVTFAEEQQDPDAPLVDLPALREFDGPVLLTHGTVSPGWYEVIIGLLAEALPNASRHLYPDAGHTPHGTHPDAYVEVVGEFMRRADAG